MNQKAGKCLLSLSPETFAKRKKSMRSSHDPDFDLGPPLDIDFNLNGLSLDVEPPAPAKLKRHRRTKAQMAQARNAAEIAAISGEALKAAEAILARATPGQRWVGAKLARNAGRSPGWRYCI